MGLKTRATIEDLYKVEGKAELVHGVIVHRPPAGDAHMPPARRLSSAYETMPGGWGGGGRMGMAWDSMYPYHDDPR